MIVYALNQEPALELHSRAAPSVEAHHCVNGPDTERNSGGRSIVKKLLWLCGWGIRRFKRPFFNRGTSFCAVFKNNPQSEVSTMRPCVKNGYPRNKLIYVTSFFKYLIVFSVNLVYKKELNLMLKVSVTSSQGAVGFELRGTDYFLPRLYDLSKK